MENFDFNNIEKYLREGGDPEAIAKAFADRLNTTIRVIDDEESLKKTSEKVSTAWNDYINVYFGTHKLPVDTVIEDWYINDTDVNAIMDSLVRVIPTVDKYIKIVENFNSAIQPTKNKINNTTIKTKNKVDTIIDDFFSKYGI